MFGVAQHQNAAVRGAEDLFGHLQQFRSGLGHRAGRGSKGKSDRLLRVGVEDKEGLQLLGGRGVTILLVADHLAFAVTWDAMGIDGQHLGGEMTQGRPQLSEHDLNGLGFGHAVGIEQIMNGPITGHEGQSVGDFKALLAEGAFLALAGQAQGRFMNQLEGQAGLHRGGVAAAPITEKIPAAQAQVLGHEQPDAHPVTGDFVAKQLAHRAL